MTKLKILTDIQSAYSEIQQAILLEDEERILRWYKHFLLFFPPIVYDMAPLILSSIKTEQYLIKLIRELHQYLPELSHTYASKTDLLHNGLYGTAVKVDNPYQSDKVIIYSQKFHENYVSSQEMFEPTIQALCAKYNILLASPSSSPASAHYKSFGEYLEIPANETSSNFVSGILNRHQPRVLVEMTPMETPVSLQMKHTYSAMINGLTISPSSFSLRRVPDFGIEDLCAKRLKPPLSHTQWTPVPAAWAAPPASDRRNYFINHEQKPSGNEIRFGAFCRLMKLDLATLNGWAIALKNFPSSKLYFSYIQTNAASEHYTKKYFESLSIDPDRIVFLPRLETNDYLKNLATMDIIFGSTPEQGGVSFIDALAMGKPYLTFDMNNTSIGSSVVLKQIGKADWSVKSYSDFLSVIEKILSSPFEHHNFFNRQKTSKDLATQQEKQRDEYHQGIFKMLDQIIH